MPLRSCSPALATALANGTPMGRADMFKFVLSGGATTLYMTSWDTDLVYGGHTYSSKKPWLSRSSWNVANTMEVPVLTVKMSALNTAFNGGGNIKSQIANGLFDGCGFLLTAVFMPKTNLGDTSIFGGMDLFGGDTAGIDVIGNLCTISVKGKVNRLDQYVPRNRYQVGCNHAFCDTGCTLSRAAYTANFVVGVAPTQIFVPWNGGAPTNYANYGNGTLVITGGAGAGQRRTVLSASTSGLVLAYPLQIIPAHGDSFSAFQGCDKTFNSGSGQSCTDRMNTQHYRGFEWIPPPSAAL